MHGIFGWLSLLVFSRPRASQGDERVLDPSAAIRTVEVQYWIVPVHSVGSPMSLFSCRSNAANMRVNVAFLLLNACEHSTC
jgi:hypothetical protein